MKLPFEIDYSNKIVVVTGAGGVLCSLISKAFAKANAKVALLDKDLNSALKVEKEIIEDGGIAKAFEADVLNKESLKKCHDEVLKGVGSLCDRGDQIDSRYFIY